MQAEEKNPGREGLKEDKDDRQAGGGRQAKNPKVLAFAVPFLLGYRGDRGAHHCSIWGPEEQCKVVKLERPFEGQV